MSIDLEEEMHSKLEGIVSQDLVEGMNVGLRDNTNKGMVDLMSTGVEGEMNSKDVVEMNTVLEDKMSKEVVNSVHMVLVDTMNSVVEDVKGMNQESEMNKELATGMVITEAGKIIDHNQKSNTGTERTEGDNKYDAWDTKFFKNC